jgi:hypothetical protein
MNYEMLMDLWDIVNHEQPYKDLPFVQVLPGHVLSNHDGG